MLEAVGFKVRPEDPVGPVATGETMHKARLARLMACKECDALLILRPDSGSWIEQEIATTGHNERLTRRWLTSGEGFNPA